jgi:hypothetical protein
MNLFNGKSNESWVSVEEIQKATGCDIGPLIVGLSQSAAKTPDNKYVVRVGDLKDYLALVGEVVKSLSEKKEKTERLEKIDTTGWLSGRKFAEAANIPLSVVNELIASGKLRAKKWARGHLVDPKEIESMPILLGRTVPEPDKGKGSDPSPPGGETEIPGQDGKDEKILPQGSEGSFGHGSYEGGILPEPKKEDAGTDSGPGPDPLLSGPERLYSREGPGGEAPGKDDDVPPTSGQDDQGKSGTGPIAAYVSITVRGEKGCLISDVARDLNVREDAIRRWIKRKAVKTMGDEEHLDPESLKAFLARERPDTVVNLIRHRGAPKI